MTVAERQVEFKNSAEEQHHLNCNITPRHNSKSLLRIFPLKTKYKCYSSFCSMRSPGLPSRLILGEKSVILVSTLTASTYQLDLVNFWMELITQLLPEESKSHLFQSFPITWPNTLYILSYPILWENVLAIGRTDYKALGNLFLGNMTWCNRCNSPKVSQAPLDQSI